MYVLIIEKLQYVFFFNNKKYLFKALKIVSLFRKKKKKKNIYIYI